MWFDTITSVVKRYNPKEIESKWQKVWEDNQLYRVSEDPGREKRYVIAMFPYPSGSGLHVGHVRNYSITDTIARFQRLQGHNVMSAIGWDAFGLPAENYAIKTGVKPQDSTAQNISNFKTQLQRIGMSFDWSREINTTDPGYYKWTQWIFTQLYKKGLAYQQDSLQWWCPHDKTVLANEQVEAGKCWRCGNTVEKKALKQWFFKITHYADELLSGIDELDWPEKIKSMQRNWIGRSNGAEVDFKLAEAEGQIKVFTTRPDTLFGATFLVLAPEHPLVQQIVPATQKPAVEDYIKASVAKTDVERQETDREKTGVFSGAYAINPLNNTKVPIWVADYVLYGYGTGAIMAVPAHDERDFEFAKKFELPITRVINNDDPDNVATTAEGVMINSGPYDGLSSDQAREKIVADIEKSGGGKAVVNFRIRDWLISRQRYWGAPIPMIHCPKDGIVPVPDKDLPVVLPEVDSYVPKGDGSISVLASIDDWVNVDCPKCGGPAKRDTDTMDGYACSSWYFLRYTDANNESRAWDPAKANYWMPIDYYCGGDHAVSHLLYSRFWMYFFADQGLIDADKKDLAKKLVYNGYINAHDGKKMSKSLGNVVDPLDLVDQGYGADALRLYELFIAPYDLDAAWDQNGITGTYRFLQRLWTLVQEFLVADTEDAEPDDQKLLRATHKTVKKVTSDLSNLNFNTAIAAQMGLVNDLYKIKAESGFAAGNWQSSLESLLLLLAPFAPHITEELWQDLGHEESIHLSHWPEYDEQYLASDNLTIAVQINGKLRAEIVVAVDAGEDDILSAAKQNERVKSYLEGKSIKKTIYVPGRLVNLVVI